jgi:hypothetical protein
MEFCLSGMMRSTKYPEGLADKDLVLYPSPAAEILGVVLEPDLPILTIEDKI